MLFDYSYVQSARPYHSTYKTPQKALDLQKRYERMAKFNNIIGNVAVGAMNFIPGVGGALSSIAKPIMEGQRLADEAMVNNELNKLIDTSYQQYLDQLPDEAAATTRPDLSLNYNPAAGEILGAATTLGAGTVNRALGNKKSTADYFAGMGINMPDPVTTYEQNEPNNFPTDNSMGGTTIETVGSGTFMNYEDGGTIVIGGNGEDDIALVDTTTGKDTGLRVAGDELIVSKENLESLKEAIGKGNKKKVFDIMAMQIDEVPEVSGGVMGFKEGGVLNADKVSVASEQELASLVKNWKKLKQEEQSLVENEVSKRGLRLEKSPNWMNMPPNIYKGETIVEGMTDFDLDGYRNVSEQVVRTMPKEAKYGQSVADVDPDAFERRTIPQLENSPFAPLNYDQPQNLITPPKRTGTGGGQRTIGEVIDIQTMGMPASVGSLQGTNAEQMAAAGLAPVNTNLVDSGYVNVEETNPYRLDFGDYSNIALSGLGYGYDAWRMRQGMKGARQPLPRWSVPARFTNYLDRLEAMSTQGLSAAEMAALQSEADRTYMYDVENIYNLSGGNAGTALGNLGRASATRNRNALNIAGLDRQAQLQNLGIYGSGVMQDVNFDRMKFGDVYNEAVLNKQTGAQLASDAMTNMMGRFNTDRFYGVGSEAWKTKKLQQELLNENLDIKKSQRQAYANMDWLPTGGTKTDAQFANDERKYTLAELKAMGLI